MWTELLMVYMKMLISSKWTEVLMVQMKSYSLNVNRVADRYRQKVTCPSMWTELPTWCRWKVNSLNVKRVAHSADEKLIAQCEQSCSWCIWKVNHSMWTELLTWCRWNVTIAQCEQCCSWCIWKVNSFMWTELLIQCKQKVTSSIWTELLMAQMNS